MNSNYLIEKETFNLMLRKSICWETLNYFHYLSYYYSYVGKCVQDGQDEDFPYTVLAAVPLLLL